MRYFLLTGILISILEICSFRASAQDTIVKTDLSMIVARVIEIGPATIKYYNLSVGEGVEYQISKSEVLKIIFKNGAVETINTERYAASRKPDPYQSGELKFGHHFIYAVPTDLLFRQVTFGYEYTFMDGHLTLGAPVSFSFASIGINDYDFSESDEFRVDPYRLLSENVLQYDKNKIFSASLDVKYFLRGQRRAGYFLGPSFQYGQYYDIAGYVENPNIYPPTYVSSQERIRFVGVLFKHGVHIQPSNHFNIVFFHAVGITERRYVDDDVNRSTSNLGAKFAFELGLSAGYRF